MVLARRSHGTLDVITDSERRALRSIGLTAQEVAIKTGELLATVFTLPSVRIFHGVRPAADVPPVPHVISAGRRLIFVESVAWPPGRYVAASAGRIYCDGVYIGQSIRPLVTAIRGWRKLVPDDHRVSAVVVVHPTGDGELVLPAATGPDLAWTGSADAVREIHARLPGQWQATSMQAIAALIAAVAGRENEAGPAEQDGSSPSSPSPGS